MELTYLQTFLEVVKRGSYTHAADQLGYAQSSVTTQIQKLEQAYGVVLFERYGRRMKLTPSGETLLHYANQIVRLHVDSKEAVSRETKGSLCIGTIETLAAFFLPQYLRAYQQDHPEMNVTIQPGNEPFIVESVKSGAMDIGFILDPPYTDPELECTLIREEALVIVAHPDHRFSRLSEIRMEDLQDESLILTEEGCTYRAMLLRTIKEYGISCKLSFEFGNLEAIKQCVIYGLGIALLPRIVVSEEIRKGQLTAAALVHPAFRFYTQMIYSKKKWVSKSFAHFLELFSAPTINHIEERD